MIEWLLWSPEMREARVRSPVEGQIFFSLLHLVADYGIHRRIVCLLKSWRTRFSMRG